MQYQRPSDHPRNLRILELQRPPYPSHAVATAPELQLMPVGLIKVSRQLGVGIVHAQYAQEESPHVEIHFHSQSQYQRIVSAHSMSTRRAVFVAAARMLRRAGVFVLLTTKEYTAEIFCDNAPRPVPLTVEQDNSCPPCWTPSMPRLRASRAELGHWMSLSSYLLSGPERFPSARWTGVALRHGPYPPIDPVPVQHTTST